MSRIYPNYVRTIDPTDLPVSIQLAKDHMRVTNTDEDEYIEGLISTAVDHCEQYLSRSIMTQTWDLFIDYFPQQFELRYGPVQSVSYIKYYDVDGVQQILDTSYYTVDTNREPGFIYLAYNQYWPSTRAIENAVTVRYITGYSSIGAIPPTIKWAIRLIVDHLYENREAVFVGQGFNAIEIPIGVKALLDKYRVKRF